MTMWRYVPLMLVVTQTAIAADYEWSLERDREDIQVYTRAVESND